MALHALHRRRRSGWRWPASSSAWFFYLVNPACRPRSSARFSAALHAARQQVLHRLVQRERPRRAPPASLGTGLWKGGDDGLIDGIVINGSARAVGGIAALDPAPADRLPLPVRAGDDRRRHRPDDLAALAFPRQPDRPLTVRTNNKNMRLAEPRHLAADPVRRAAARLRPRRPRRRGALGRADRRAGELPGHAAARHRLRHSAPRRCSSSRSTPGSTRFNVKYHLGVDGISLWFVLLTAFITVIVVIRPGR